ncbi:MAG: efflux transporter periplasmic adaptor subunit [Gammaproteobacteria bacterium]|nr:MAG: efflux transporter periplasmic adaptor subunit [Pseudomonadota bacterium]PIE38627.1 MAG: efflux transporter periplasmic adaptor subunit [Gammaproteobacteria bacterium]
MHTANRFTNGKLLPVIGFILCMIATLASPPLALAETNLAPAETNRTEKTGQTANTASTSESAVPVYCSTIDYEEVSQTVYATGKLAHKGRQSLAFKVSGTITRLNVEEGQRVKKGEVLASLGQRETNAELTKARSVYQQRQRDLTRLLSLYKKKVIPRNQMQDAQTALEVAEANLDLARERKKHLTIVAPQDGIILGRYVEERELVAPHQRAFVLSDTSKGWVIRTEISDKDIVRINQRDHANIRLDAYPDQIFSGQVSEVAAAAKPDTLLFEIEVQLDPTDRRLLEGFIGHLEIIPAATDTIAWLPIESIVAADRGKVKLFSIDDDQTVHLQEASMAWMEQGRIAIKKGIKNGTRIVTLGATFLHEGSKVEIARSARQKGR